MILTTKTAVILWAIGQKVKIALGDVESVYTAKIWFTYGGGDWQYGRAQHLAQV